jgi:hypothetical protein
MSTISLTAPFVSGPWTLYFHAPKERRWTLDTFKKIATVNNVQDVLSLFNEIGEKLKYGMFFFMKGSIPPLWENYQNIRGGSYSLRGNPTSGIEYYKIYVIAAMLNLANKESEDTIQGISISPKIMNGPSNTSRIGFYVIKIWNKDSEKFNNASGLQLLHSNLLINDIIYTPHVDKKM